MKFVAFSTALLLLVGPLPTNALAADDLVAANAPKTVLQALAALGYPGKLDKLDSGRPEIAVPISGLKTFIDFYDCTKTFTDCDTLLFYVALDLDDGTTPGKVNDWNSKQVIGRMSLDQNADPTLDFSVSTYDGVSQDLFGQNVRRWAGVINDFKDYFDFR